MEKPPSIEEVIEGLNNYDKTSPKVQYAIRELHYSPVNLSTLVDTVEKNRKKLTPFEVIMVSIEAGEFYNHLEKVISGAKARIIEDILKDDIFPWLEADEKAPFIVSMSLAELTGETLVNMFYINCQSDPLKLIELARSIEAIWRV